MSPERCGIIVRADSGPGVLHQLSGVIAHRRGDISSVEIISLGAGGARVYFEIELPDLVVTDPVQAGVMTVMAVADTARFRVGLLKRRVF